MNIRSKTILAALLVLILSMSVSIIALAGAYTEGGSISYEIDVTLFVPCAAGGTGEFAEFTGRRHDMYNVTFDESGGYHLVLMSQPMGISGVGETTGVVYRAAGVMVQQYNQAQVGETFTLLWRYNLVGPGKDNTFYLHETIHYTINANGELTAEVENFSTGCK